jgi:K+-transporting ATPase ATPase C chain
MRHLRVAFLLFLVFTVLTGLIYPLLVTGIAQAVFPHRANGSLIEKEGHAGNRLIGSALIGQPFSDPRFFWGRPSATTPFPYNAANSGGSNLGPTTPDLLKRVAADVARLRAARGTGPVPVDLVTSSASGLDPHISPAAALYQVDRVAQARGLDPAAVRRLVEEHVEGRQLGVLGEPRVNVLLLNLALEGMHRAPGPHPLTPSPATPHTLPGRGGTSARGLAKIGRGRFGGAPPLPGRVGGGAGEGPGVRALSGGAVGR